MGRAQSRRDRVNTAYGYRVGTGTDPDILFSNPAGRRSAAVVPLTAGEAAAATVSRIAVEGNQRVDDETIRAYLSIRPGKSFSAQDVDQSLKALFETGLFSDVSIVQRGGTLVVSVDENPIINKIAFEGNKKFKDDQLKSVVQSRERGVFTRARVQTDVQRILELYRRSGRFRASVEPKVIDLPRNRVNVVYEVVEGPETGVARISFIGNKAFQRCKLRMSWTHSSRVS